MRIISGLYGGRKIQPVPSKQTRPTTDRVREAWASTLTSLMSDGLFDGKRVLDAFAGSGALGLELLSRGAKECLFVEQNKTAFQTLKSNSASLGLSGNQAQVCMANSLSPQLLTHIKSKEPFDIIVLDPPYKFEITKVKELLTTLAGGGYLAPQTLVSYEHAATDTQDLEGFTLSAANSSLILHVTKSKTYGSTCLDYYLCTTA